MMLKDFDLISFDAQGGKWIMKRKTIIKTSRFPASEKNVFNKLKSMQTLQYIASPYATFTPINGGGDLNWKEGETFSFHFKLFGVIPFGVHTIKVIDFDEKTYRIYTNESNTYVPIWNHSILLKPLGDDGSQYTDEVEIYAGWKTPFVYLWAKCFYAHRQKKWVKLLSNQGAL